MLEQLWKDLCQAVRSLRREPSFSSVAVLFLALGIAGNTVIFSALDAVVLRPLPFANSQRLVMIWETRAGQSSQDSVAPNHFLAWREQSRSWEGITSFFPYIRLGLLVGDRPEQVVAASVSSDYFSLLGARAVLGRVFGPADSGGREVVLSDPLWHSRFAADPRMPGRVVKMNGELFTVVGVMPAAFQFPAGVDLWMQAPDGVPDLFLGRKLPTQRDIQYLRVVGLLRPGRSLRQAQQEMDALARRIDPTRGVRLTALQQQVVGDIRPVLLVLMAAVAVVQLIACANLSNLLFIRAIGRRREMAIRLALGAGRGRLLRQLLAESLLLAAGALGILLAWWGLGLLLKWIPSDVPRLAEISLDARVLAFVLGLSLLTGIVFGLLPALEASQTVLTEALKEGGRGGLGVRRQWVQSYVLVWEVALTLVLLTGAGLLLRSFIGMEMLRPEFDASRLLTFKIDLSAQKYQNSAAIRTFFPRLLERLDALPGVDAAASLTLPNSREEIRSSFTVEGRPVPPPDQWRSEGVEVVTPDYFRILGIQLLRGREFTPQDSAESPGVVVVNEPVAKHYWGDANPLGQRISYDSPGDPAAKWLTVVGVVRGVPSSGPDRKVRPIVYRSYLQQPWPFMLLFLRTRGDPHALPPAIQRAVAEIDPEQPVADLRTMEESLAQELERPRFTLALVGAFAGLATFLAMLGVYGVASYGVSQRRREIGLRMALGADRLRVLRQFIGTGLIAALAGTGVGLTAALALNRVIRSLLFEVGTGDPLTYMVAGLLVLLLSLLASLLPALRAARLEPANILRGE
jgi:putative ABC transport system permease protein